MRSVTLLVLGILGISLLSACSYPPMNTGIPASDHPSERISLPKPTTKSDYSLEEAIFERISVRSFADQPLSLEQVAQLLWAAQGTGVDGLSGASRTAPSAGATHPMEIYLIAGDVNDLEPGVYRYNYADHTLAAIAREDLRRELAAAALNQGFVASAPASFVLAADYDRTTSRYGDRGLRYVHIEAGHITQNIYLQCQSLNLGAVAVGAYDDQKVKALLGIEEVPLMIVSVGERSSR